jgi:hypothetical protein
MKYLKGLFSEVVRPGPKCLSATKEIVQHATTSSITKMYQEFFLNLAELQFHDQFSFNN